MIFEDQLAALERDSQEASAPQGGDIDFALLVDGLAAEREQGITIDVAYRFFSTDKRKFIVADTPGPRAVHPQHGHRRLHRRPGGDPDRRAQGRADPDPPAQLHRARCSASATSCWRSTRWTWSAIDQERLRRASSPTTAPSPTELGFADVTAIPMSALQRRQHHRAERPTRPGTTGPTLLEHLETVDVDDDATRPSRSACRCSGSTGPNLDFRGFAGTIAARHGRARATRSSSLPSGQRQRRSRASSPSTATSTEARRRPVGHADPGRRDRRQPRRRASPPPTTRPRSPTSSRRTLVWMADEPLLPGRSYLLKIGTPHGRRPRSPTLEAHRSTSTRWSTLAAKTLALNEIGVVQHQPRRADRVRPLRATTATPAASS